MTQHGATHCDAPQNTTATHSNVPQGGTRQTPALQNNGTQHAAPQPNGGYRTPHNTAKCCTTQPTTQNTITRGMAQPAPGTTRHNLTPHNETPQHTLRHDPTPQPRVAIQPNAANAAQNDNTTMGRHATNHKQNAATQHDLTLPPMCRSSSTWLLLTDDKERHLCRAIQRANRIQETLTQRGRGMPPTNPVWCTHA